jgi:hypothetical protein
MKYREAKRKWERERKATCCVSLRYHGFCNEMGGMIVHLNQQLICVSLSREDNDVHNADSERLRFSGLFASDVGSGRSKSAATTSPS